MHADNRHIQIGDTLTVGKMRLKVVGLVYFVNYSTLYENNTDSMFDAIRFDVAVVTPETFGAIEGDVVNNTAYRYDTKPKNKTVEKKRTDKLMTHIAKDADKDGNELTDFVPAYENQAITFATEDMDGDKTMGNYLLYILVVVLAFIFGITINNTIESESAAIGTLRASGYTRGELTRHYMAPPVIVSATAAVVGNILGYTVFRDVVAGMYYNSYSLPRFQAVWTPDAFWSTTVVPLVLMIVIDFIIIRTKLKLPVQALLRGDLRRKHQRGTLKLKGLPFILRFRLRIFFQNISNYAILLVGMVLVMVMMLFATAFPQTLSHYQKTAVNNLFVKHQVFLKQTTDDNGRAVTTNTVGAEPFSMHTFVTNGGAHDGESIMFYGTEINGRYVVYSRTSKVNGVAISKAYADKFGIRVGDKIHLKEKYTDKHFSMKVATITDYTGGLAVFVPNSVYNQMFGLPDDAFDGYWADKPIKDIPKKYIASEMGVSDITKITRQLDHSMGDYMTYFKVACIALSALLLYLLTKTIIERNRSAISMAKILGYSSREIASLYMTVTTVVVALWEIIAMAVANVVIQKIWQLYLNTIDGWMAYYSSGPALVGVFAAIFAAYFVIAFVNFKRIEHIPMDEALKNVG